jgi:hypothetical protein
MTPNSTNLLFRPKVWANMARFGDDRIVAMLRPSEVNVIKMNLGVNVIKMNFGVNVIKMNFRVNVINIKISIK